MTRQISEADWKVFRKLHPVALDRFCQRALAEVTRLLGATGGSHRERYRAVYQLVAARDQELADAFDDVRRSTAWRQVAAIQSLAALTEEELSLFSPETRSVVRKAREPGQPS